MAYLYQAVLKLASVSGLPENNCLNVFHFEEPTDVDFDDADAATLAGLLIAWCNNVPTGGASDLASYIGEHIKRSVNACEILVYGKADYDGAVGFGSPQYSQSFTLDAATAGTMMPAEVAMALSFHGDLAGIQETEANPTPPPAFFRPRARRRGRVFVGPLQVGAGVEDSGIGDLIPSSAFRNTCTGCMIDLATNADGEGIPWVVYSRVDGAAYPVVGGWLDYAFDTQRRRGTAPFARSTWP